MYAKRVQDTVTRRLKGPSADAEKFRAMQPVMQMLSQRYGVDAADIKALMPSRRTTPSIRRRRSVWASAWIR